MEVFRLKTWWLQSDEIWFEIKQNCKYVWQEIYYRSGTRIEYLQEYSQLSRLISLVNPGGWDLGVEHREYNCIYLTN